MHRRKLGRGIAAIAILAATALGAACTPTPGGPQPPAVPSGSFTFKAISAKNTSSNDECGLLCLDNDEPYPINIGFTVKIGQANSATAQAVVGTPAWDWWNLFDQGPDQGDTYTFAAGGEQAPVTMSNIPLLDIVDLAWTTNKLTVAGVWSWAYEGDVDPIGPAGMATTIANAIKAALNATLAVGTLPNDPNQIVNMIIGVITSNLFPTIGSFFAGLVPWGDDAMGSRMYIGLGVRGTLKSIIDGTVGAVTFPSVAIPVVSSPPDINGGAIFSLGNQSFNNQAMTNGGVQGQHDYAFQLTQN
ncbi:MAG: hypothetical protein IT195_08925 [Microthrixaceae bacterium]|nr:hypothetical protein [Microthrixaceae bacterium]